MIDREQWLVSTLRELKDLTRTFLVGRPEIGNHIEVEMSFPDTRDWGKTSPLTTAVVHFELDDHQSPILGFGTPGDGEEVEIDEVLHYEFTESSMHHLNFDVGIWASPEVGGVTKRMQIRQALTDLFCYASSKEQMQEEHGIYPLRYERGADILDRVNDLPIYRMAGGELVIQVFGAKVHDPVPLATSVSLAANTSIIGNDGQPVEIDPDDS